MKCSKCGVENDNSKFCSNCGAQIEVQEVKEVTQNTNNNVPKKTGFNALTWTALGLLIMRYLTAILAIFIYKSPSYESLSFLNIVIVLPYSITSLILSIISKVKNKDKVSTVLLILNIVTLVIIVILALILIVSFISGCYEYNNMLKQHSGGSGCA